MATRLVPVSGFALAILLIIPGMLCLGNSPGDEEPTEALPVLFEMIEAQNWEGLQEHLTKGGDANVRRPGDGWTPLLLAVEKNDVTLAAILMRHGADPNLRSADIFQDPPLHHALNHQDNLDMIGMLINAGADPNALSGNKLNTALMKAVTAERLEIVRIMLAHGGDINAQALNGTTAVLRARNVKNRDLWELIEAEWQKTRKSRAEHRKPMRLNEAEQELFAAMEAGDATGALKILQAQGELINPNAASANRVSLLMLSAYRGFPNIARFLLEQGANVHAGNDPPVLFFALKPDNAMEMVALLLEYGADPNARRERDERTILMESIVKQKPEVARALLAAGARLDYADVTGTMALDLARADTSRNWEKELSPYIGEAGEEMQPAGPAATLAHGGTTSTQPALDPAIYAAKNLEPNKHRLELHLAVAQSSHLQLQELLADGADILSYSGRGRTALMSAAELVDYEMCRMLLDAGSEVNQLSRDDYRAPAIIYAASKKNSLNVIRLLHQKGAQLNVQMGEWGYTPLMLATALGEEETVRYLLSNGASTRVVAPDGSSAMTFAERGGNETIRQLLSASAKAGQ